VATFIFMLPGTIAFITFSSSLLGLLKGKVSREFFIGIALIVAVSSLPKLATKYRNRKPRELRPAVPWDLRRSLQRKAIGTAALGVLGAGVYALVMHYFWALDAYLYTIEFNLLFVAHRLADADLAGFVEYLKPMSGARAGLIALVWQAMQACAFPFTALAGTAAFATAFGAPTGAWYSWLAGLTVAILAVGLGRVLLGDALPLYHRGKGADPLKPTAAWAGWCAAAMAVIPGFPLLLLGLWTGACRIPLLRSVAVIAAGLAVRTLVSLGTR
jgi:uncharacterized membrane protein YdjX (TVP38/TMEM64 family)